MKAWQILIAALITFGFSHALSAHAEKKAAPKVEEEEQLVETVTCTQGKEIRRLEIHTKGAGCALHYFKAGKSKEIAAAKHTVDLCKKQLKQVRGTLESSDYRCE